jgi:hypothetical protein
MIRLETSELIHRDRKTPQRKRPDPNQVRWTLRIIRIFVVAVFAHHEFSGGQRDHQRRFALPHTIEGLT